MATEKTNYTPETEDYDLEPPHPEATLLRDLNAKYGLDDQEPITNLHWEKTHEYLHDLATEFNAAFPPDATANDKMLAAGKAAHQLLHPIATAWEAYTPHQVSFQPLLDTAEGIITAALAADEPRRLAEILDLTQRWGGEAVDPKTSPDYRSGYCGSEITNFASIAAAARRFRQASDGTHTGYESRSLDAAGWQTMTNGIASAAADPRYGLEADRQLIQTELLYGQDSDQCKVAQQEVNLYAELIRHFASRMYPGQSADPLRLGDYPTQEQRHELMVSHQRDHIDPIRNVTEALHATLPENEDLEQIRLNPADSSSAAWQQIQDSWKVINEGLQDPGLKAVGQAMGQRQSEGWNIRFSNETEEQFNRWQINTAAMFEKLAERLQAADQWLADQNRQPVEYTIEQLVAAEMQEFAARHPAREQESAAQRARFASLMAAGR